MKNRKSYFFLFIRVFFTNTYDSQDSRGRERTIFFSTLPLPPAYEQWDIYLQLCMWDDYHIYSHMTITYDYHIYNRNACVYQIATRWDLPPYRITIWVIDWWCNVCLFTWWIDTRFCYSDLTLETGEFEPTSTITFVLQTKRLTKCASHPSTITLVLQANLLTKSVDKGKAMNRYQATRKYKK